MQSSCRTLLRSIPKKAADIHEVLNYRTAMRQAIDGLDDLPLCSRLICRGHATLLEDVRGHDKARGKYRTIQNYIGKPGRPIEDARLVPIAPEQVSDGMSRWEKYLHADAPDALVQLAIVHAEFESLHPFLDGNGRMGRMLVPLFLFERKLLHTPMFYVSASQETKRERNLKTWPDELLPCNATQDDEPARPRVFWLSSFISFAGPEAPQVGARSNPSIPPRYADERGAQQAEKGE